MTDNRKMGTFEGVFTPSILTILGVIMYLRLGWVVGNAGLGGALIIIMMANLVTITTGLSLSSIATNIKIGAGGFYALISRSLGPEVGSAIGIPLYFSQTLGVALYTAGFTEGWLSIFPAHPPLIVASTVLLFIFIVSIISAKIAMKVQFLIMTLLALSLISFFAGKGDMTREIILWGDFQNASFWKVFAIFFPAVTGIGVGASMSGDLKDSRRSLPRGILPGIGISMIIYLTVACWLDRQADSQSLINNYSIMIDLSRWPVLVLGGILGATLSSALGSLVGSPRTLFALARDKVIPYPKFFLKTNKRGEPYLSLIITTVIVEFCLILGDLNTIAPLVTMFFLITYGVLNFSVAIEKGIKIPSFRPTFKIHILFPIIGGLSCLIAMFLVNPVFAALAIIFILVFYIFQVKKGMRAPWGDVRSGLFNAIAEWSAKASAQMPQNAKTWKPNMLIPIEDPENWTQLGQFIRDITFPSGSLRLFSIRVIQSSHKKEKIKTELLNKKKTDINITESTKKLSRALEYFVNPLKEEGIFTADTAIECSDFNEGMRIITQITKGMFFPPNILFLTMSRDAKKSRNIEAMISDAIKVNMGVAVLSLHPKNGFGNRKVVSVWLRKSSPNRHLALLLAIQLQKNWDAQIELIFVASDENEKKIGERILLKIADKARLPSNTEINPLIGNFGKILINRHKTDLNIFGMAENIDGYSMNKLTKLSNASCVFVKDSGEENIMA